MEINFLSFLMAMKFEAMITLIIFFLLIVKIEGRAGNIFVIHSILSLTAYFVLFL